jgi:hypothetical protein
MGTFRDEEDRNFIQGVTEEVTNLFGTNAILHKINAIGNVAIKDPLYDEPTCGDSPQYISFVIKAFFFAYQDTPFVTSEGLYSEATASGHVTFNHLEQAGVTPDPITSERLSEGDVIELHPDPQYGRIVFDIIQTTKDGFINDTGRYTGYTFTMKRSTKYPPERKGI